ncbi:Cytidine deaminase (Cdd) [Fructobacillus cardui]|nr:Cytidine deaminase (Cdd) [Fructobacillus cardui]
MDIWERLFTKTEVLYNPHNVSPFIYAQHVVTAIEADDGNIYTGFCFEATAGVFHLCAERAAAFSMFQHSGQTKTKKSSPSGTVHQQMVIACLVAPA